MNENENNTNNLSLNFLYIVIFYVIFGILYIGIILNMIGLTKTGQYIKISIFKKSVITNFFTSLLSWLSLICIPIALIVMFTSIFVLHKKEPFIYF